MTVALPVRCSVSLAILSSWADKTRTSCPSTSCYSGPFCVPSARGRAKEERRREERRKIGRFSATAFSPRLSKPQTEQQQQHTPVTLIVFTGGGRHTEATSDGAARHLSADAISMQRPLPAFFFPGHLNPLRKCESQLQQHD